ncbi:hypothetical protein L596_009886 [Steinernema carpocapsae]|uniref:Uncharacterized protein n=1 Tax=Steinernema carpocapsae TaxID=34508 RepID=A0A4U5PGY8_STECR|nr:hypothetical protein L596_009886 [Steinernema carpocapsae]
MTDPYPCLRRASIVIAVWSILYCLIQFAVLGWQTSYVRDRQWEFENRKVPPDGGPTYFGARHPGLYTIYTETPERRRINALFAIVLVALVCCLIHLITSVGLLIGAARRTTWLIFIWFFSMVATIVTSATYAIVWWSGDIFNEQLTMSVAEFGLALVNCPCFVIVLIYYLRLTGKLTSDKPPDPMLRFAQESDLPSWRNSFRERPSKNLLRKLRRQERRRVTAAWDAYEKNLAANGHRSSLPQEQRQWSPDYRNHPSDYYPQPNYASPPIHVATGILPQPHHVSRIDQRASSGQPLQRRFSSSPDKSALRRSRSKSPTARRVYNRRLQECYTNV